MPVVPNPGIRIDGKLNNPKAATRKNLSTDMKVGRQNVFDYTDSTVSDGSTDARAAILAADAVGPVILPPGTYAIASNMTLTNNVKFEPGAKLKPANGVYIISNGQVEAEAGQIFDLSAGGFVGLNPQVQQEVLPEWWGAVAMEEPRDRTVGAANTNDGTGYLNRREVVDSTAAFQAIANSFQGPPTYVAGGDPEDLLAAFRYSVSIKLSGWYALTDEVIYHDAWYHFEGKSPAYNGTGLKWCGTIGTSGGLKFWNGNETDTVVTYSQSGTTVTGASGSFDSFDIGKKIVWTSGAGSGTTATIVSITSDSVVEVTPSQTVAAGTIKYFRLASETSMFILSGCSFSAIKDIGFYGKPTIVEAERLLCAIRFAWLAGTGVQTRIKLTDCIINDASGFDVEDRQGFATKYGLMQGGNDSTNGNNDFHQIDNLVISRCVEGIRIEQSQAVDWQINNYGFGQGNVMFSSLGDMVFYGTNWYAASDTWEGVFKFGGTYSNVVKCRLTNFSCEHLRALYFIHTDGTNVLASISGTYIQAIDGLQYRTISVAGSGGTGVATVSGTSLSAVPTMSQFFFPYMEGMMLTWQTGADATATAIIDSVTSPTTANLTFVSTSGNIASGRATLSDADGLRVFKVFDGPESLSAQISFQDFVFENTVASLYSPEYYSADDTRFVYEIGNTENRASYRFSYINCYTPLLLSYIKDSNPGGLGFNTVVDFDMKDCRSANPMPSNVSRRYFYGTEDAEGMTSISSYMTDAINQAGNDSVSYSSLLGGLDNRLQSKAHRIPSSAVDTLTIENFFKANRLYLGLAAYPWYWNTVWNDNNSSVSTITQVRFGNSTDPDYWGAKVFSSNLVHRSYVNTPITADDDLVIRLLVNTALNGWTFSQTGTTVSGASGGFVTADIGKTITWTSGANAGDTVTITSINSTTSVEVSGGSASRAAGTIEYGKNAIINGFMMVQTSWLEIGIGESQFSTQFFSELPLETVT